MAKEITGLTMHGKEVKAHSTGALYQIVPSDTTTEGFIEVIQKGAEKLPADAATTTIVTTTITTTDTDD